MLSFVTFAVKLQLNVHDLNNEAVAGNVTDIRIMDFLDEDGNRIEAPAVSGRMLKHWHYEAMRKLCGDERIGSFSMCDGCKAGEPIRPGELDEKNNLKQVARGEEHAIENCGVCDVHGYLIAKGAEDEQGQGISSRRSSRVLFSWLMPVVGKETTTKQVIHNRVSADPGTMMPFNKSYASGFYGFVSALDVERIGVVESKLGMENGGAAVLQDDERIRRIKAAIESYRYVIAGQIGASLSHALPHATPLEVVAAYTTGGPLPFPVSPIYSNYLDKIRGLMPKNCCLLYWGDGEPKGFTKVDTVDSLFARLFDEVKK